MARTINEKYRQEKRNNIIQVAISLFPVNGFSQTTISMIAKKAGMSTSTVLLYFPSKEDLFHCAVLESLTELKSLFINIEPETHDPAEQITKMVIQHITALSKRIPYLKLIHYVINQHERFPELTKEIFTVSEEFIEFLSLMIKKGQELEQVEQTDARETAWAYLAYINGISVVITEPEESPFWKGLIRQGIRIVGGNVI